MTVAELIAELSKYPEYMEVCILTRWDGWQTPDKVERGAVSRMSQSERKWKKIEIIAIGRIAEGNWETL